MIRIVAFFALLLCCPVPAGATEKKIVIFIDQSASMQETFFAFSTGNLAAGIVESAGLPALVSVVGFGEQVYSQKQLTVDSADSLQALRDLVNGLEITGLLTDLEIPLQLLEKNRSDLGLAVVISDGEPDIWDEKKGFLSRHVRADDRYNDLNRQYEEMVQQGLSGVARYERLAARYLARNIDFIEQRLAGWQDQGGQLVFMDLSGRYGFFQKWAGISGGRYIDVHQAFMGRITSTLANAYAVQAGTVASVDSMPAAAPVRSPAPAIQTTQKNISGPDAVGPERPKASVPASRTVPEGREGANRRDSQVAVLAGRAPETAMEITRQPETAPASAVKIPFGVLVLVLLSVAGGVLFFRFHKKTVKPMPARQIARPAAEYAAAEVPQKTVPPMPEPPMPEPPPLEDQRVPADREPRHQEELRTAAQQDDKTITAGKEKITPYRQKIVNELIADSKSVVEGMIDQQVEEALTDAVQKRAELLAEHKKIEQQTGLELRRMFRLSVPANSMFVLWTDQAGTKRNGMVRDVSMQHVSFASTDVAAKRIDHIDCPGLDITFHVNRSSIERQDAETAVATIEEFAGGVDDRMHWVEVINSVSGAQQWNA